MTHEPDQEPKSPPQPQESIVQEIGRLYGTDTRVMLHDAAEESGPLLPSSPSGDELADDSQYQILGFIAKGGVGVVYKARDKNLGREVALKVLRPDRTGAPHVAERLVEEAQVGGQLQHPGVVPVYGIGVQKDGRPHFAMKLIKGSTLASILQDRKDPHENQAKLLGYFEQLCHTMAYSHARGVIHRDLKPANIMVGPFGEVLVVDWGFGKVLGVDSRGRKKTEDEPQMPLSIIATLRSGSQSSDSVAGSIMGTPAYMPPEQALGQVELLDERADVFALGAILCEILSGLPPYVGDPGDVLIMAAQGRLDDAVGRLDGCGADPALIGLAKECLAPMPKERPRTAGKVGERLQAHFVALEERARKAKVDAAKAHTLVEEQRARVAAEKLKAEKERAIATEERIKRESARAAAEEQQRQTTWERQRHRRTILLAALVLLAVVVAGGGYVTLSSAEETRSAERDVAFSKAVGTAMDHAAGRRWREAVTAAEGTLTQLGPEDEPKRVLVTGLIEEWRNKDRAEKAAAQRIEEDQRVLETLRDLRASAAGNIDAVEVDIACGNVFREYGVDVLKLPPEQAAAKLEASPIRVELAAFLDWWISLRRQYGVLKGRDWKKLLAIVQRADPDPTRRKIRDFVARDDNLGLAHLASSKEIEHQPAHTLTQLAQALVAMGDAPGSVSILRRARERYPDDVWVNFQLAIMLTILKPPRPDEAARYMHAALAAQPDSDLIRQILGALLGEAGDWEAAAALWKILVRKEPDDSYLHSSLSGALFRLGDNDGAQASAERALELAPTEVGPWAALLGVLRRRPDAQDHLAHCEKALKEFPDHPDFLARRALALERVGKHVEALAAAEQALEVSDTRIATCVAAATLLRTRGDAGRAVRILQKAVDTNNQTLGYYSTASVAFLTEREFISALEDTGELDKSAANLNQRRTRNPRDLAAQWGVAGILRAQHRYADELRVRLEIIALDSYDNEAYEELGDLLMRMNRAAEATGAYRQAIRFGPERGEYHAALGRSLAAQGKSQEAMEQCLKARQLDPRSMAVRRDLVAVLVANGRVRDAVHEAGLAAKEAPELARPLAEAGEAQLMAGDVAGAVETLERAFQLAPRHGATLHALSEALYRVPELAKVHTMLLAATALRPRDVELRLRLAAVYGAQGKTEDALGQYQLVQRLAPSLAAGYSGEAWVRGRSPVAELRKPDLLLRLAQRAVDLDPRDGNAWRALALARHLAGDAKAAVAACTTALERSPDDNAAAEILFLRAIASMSLRLKANATASYQEGLRRLERADGPARDRDALRAEAATLLGLEGK